ncbi:MAG: hypothetical protein GF315_10790 [candidate division Zixibacteria bacterium]|nr:hypothetical protein [candidate division Zixibacteria bacterium]
MDRFDLSSSLLIKIAVVIAVFTSLLLTACAGSSGSLRIADSIEHPPPTYIELLEFVGPELTETDNLRAPVDVDFDLNGNLFICDLGNSRVIKLDEMYNLVKEVGGISVGIEKLISPIAIASGNGLTMYIADSQRRRLVRYDRDLNYVDYFAQYNDGSGSPVNIGQPQNLYIAQTGEIYISEADKNRILILDALFNYQSEVGGFGYGIGEVSSPQGLAKNESDKLLVADSDNGRIVVYNELGQFMGEFGTEHLRNPIGIAIDQWGYIYVSDSVLGSIAVFSSDGQFLLDSAEYGVALDQPTGIAFSPDDKLYVADRGSNRIAILKPIRQN